MGTKTSWLHKVGRAAVTLAILLALAQTLSCGRGGLFRRHRSDAGNAGGAMGVSTTLAKPTAPRVRSLDDILREIDAYPTPKDVNAETWNTLKAELKRLLIARADREAKSGIKGTAGFPAGDQPLGKAAVPSGGGKTISIAPVGSPNAVTDLGASANPAGTQSTLTWCEKLPGDYDNDGRVFIADLRPMALYYMQKADAAPYDGHRLINDDADPEINIIDLQPVANNYDASVQGYQVIRGTGNASAQTWEPVIRANPNPDPLHAGWSADRPSPPPVSCRPTYGYVDDISGVPDKAHVVYKVVPIGDGATGAESNVAVMSLSGLANSPWPKYHCDARNSGLSPYVGAQTNTIKWTLDAGGSFTSPPVIGPDGTVYIGCGDFNDKCYVYAVEGGTGTVKWMAVVDSAVDASPAVARDGTVYAGSYDGIVYAINPSDGSIKWTYTTGAEILLSNPPSIGGDGSVYIGSDNGNLYALNPLDGSTKWKYATGGRMWSCPAINADGTIFIGTKDVVSPGSQGSLHALRPDGSKKWSVVSGCDSVLSPAIGPDGTVYAATEFGAKVDSLNPADGTRKWTFNVFSAFATDPTVGPDGTVYTYQMALGTSYFCALDPASGKIKWWWQTDDLSISSPAIGADGLIYEGGAYGFYALNPSDGSIKWSCPELGFSDCSPAIGADGTVYAPAGGTLFAFGTPLPTNHSVSGRITDPSGKPLSGFRVAISPTSRCFYTGSDGTFSFAALKDGVYTLQPIMSGYYFTPASRLVVVSGADIAGQDFVATAGAGTAEAIVRTTGGNGLAGVTITLTPGGRTGVTDSNGVCDITSVQAGQYTETPMKPGFSFSPASELVTVNPNETNSAFFYATPAPPGHNVSGRATYSGGPGLQGVAMVLSPGNQNATTAPDGSYTITDIADGSYSLTPVKAGFTFTPPSRAVAVSGADIAGQDFTATTTGHAVSGTVTNSITGAGVEGVTVTLTPGGQSATTLADGTYWIAAVEDGSYTLTPAKAGYTFTPPSRPVTVAGADVPAQDFTGIAAGHSVSGRVTDSATSAGMAGVIVALAPGGQNAATLANGTYVITGVQDGSYTATPLKQGYVFAPPYRPIDMAGADITGVDFVGTSAYTVSGRVTDSMGFGVQGVTMTLTPGGPSATTLADGTYAIVDVVNGGYTLTPFRQGYSFTPTNRAVTISGADVTGQDFAVVGGLANSAWPRYGHDARNTGQSPYVGAQTNAVKWHYKTGQSIYGSPVIGPDGTVYAASQDKNLYALNPEDGSVIWTRAVNSALDGDSGPGPAIGQDGTLYFIDRTNGAIYALSPADGSLRWSETLGATANAPGIGLDGTIYVSTVEGNLGSKLYAISPLDGSTKWVFPLLNDYDSSPVLGPDGTIYVHGRISISTGYEYILSAVNPDGTLKWSTNAGNSTPSSVADDGTIYTAGSGMVSALNPADASIRWQSANIGAGSSPAVGSDGSLYVSAGSQQVYRLSSVDGSVSWSSAAGTCTCPPAAIGSDGTVYAGADGFSGLNGTDGSVKWQYPHALSASSTRTPAAIGADGTVYVGFADGRLYAFNTPTSTHSLSGTIIDLTTGVGLGGANVSLMPGAQTTTTQADGSYIFTGVVNGTYTVTPSQPPQHWMNPRNRTVVVLNDDVTGVDFTAEPGGVANSPWPKFHGNVANTGLRPYVGIQVKSLKWTFQTGGQVWSSPVIGADGTIYVGGSYVGSSSHNIYALNPSDGSMKWSLPVGGPIYGAPAVGAAGTVFVSVADPGNAAYAINPADGSVKWKVYDFEGRTSPSIAADGTVYLPSAMGGGGALNQDDGSQEWGFSYVYYSSPAIGLDGTIFVGLFMNSINAVNPWDGSTKWQYYNASENESSPALGADGTVYIGGGDGKLYAFNPSDGSTRWVTSLCTGVIRSSPAIGPSGTIYVGCNDGKLYSINPVDGSIIDTFPTGGAIWSSPAVGALETVYFGSYDGYVYAVNAVAHPKIPMWTYQTGGAVRSSPAIGADGTVYIGSNDGKVYAFGM